MEFDKVKHAQDLLDVEKTTNISQSSECETCVNKAENPTIVDIYNDFLCDVDSNIKNADNLLKVLQTNYFTDNLEGAKKYNFMYHYDEIDSLLSTIHTYVFNTRKLIGKVLDIDIKTIKSCAEASANKTREVENE